MQDADRPPAPRTARDMIAAAAFLMLTLGLGGIGGAVTSTSVDTWYQTLEKPPYNPPDWVFGPVWTVLYVMIAIAGWRVWRRAGFAGARPAMTLYGVQLALNLAWSVLFFGLRSPGLALLEVLLLLAAIVATIVAFRPIDRVAAWLMVPYALWVAYAAVLNASIVWLN